MTSEKIFITRNEYPRAYESNFRGKPHVNVSVPRKIQHAFGSNTIKRVAPNGFIKDEIKLTHKIYDYMDRVQAEAKERYEREAGREIREIDWNIDQFLLTMMDYFPQVVPRGESVFRTIDDRGEPYLNNITSDMPYEDLKAMRERMDQATAMVWNVEPSGDERYEWHMQGKGEYSYQFDNMTRSVAARYMQPDMRSYWEDMLITAAHKQDKPVPEFSKPTNEDFWFKPEKEGLWHPKPLENNKRPRQTTVPTLSTVRDEFVNYTQESFEYGKYIKCRKALDEFIDLVGDIEPSKIDRRMAAQFISAYFKLYPKAAKASMGNKMGSLSTFHRWAWKKGLMEELNPFKDYKIEPNEGVQTKSFEPFSQEDLVYIFNQDWESHSPHARLLLALLTITGCRLNEIASLSWRRIIQDNEMTYITFIPEATKTDVFRVKEKQGEESKSSARREIPLHKELILPKRPADPDALLFPFTRSRLTGKANSLAELAINHQFKNPSIRRLFPNEPLKRVHSFRSSLARMLTEVNTPIDIKGWITGHKIKNALSDTYDGASRTKKLNYLNQIDFSKINLNG